MNKEKEPERIPRAEDKKHEYTRQRTLEQQVTA